MAKLLSFVVGIAVFAIGASNDETVLIAIGCALIVFPIPLERDRYMGQPDMIIEWNYERRR